MQETSNEATEALLQEYEELFKHRYTETDEEYMKTVAQSAPPPPCVENWYTRPKRNFDYTRNQQRRGHHGHRGRGGYDHRHGGQGQGYRQGHGHGYGHGQGHGHQGQNYQRGHRDDYNRGHQSRDRYRPY